MHTWRKVFRAAECRRHNMRRIIHNKDCMYIIWHHILSNVGSMVIGPCPHRPCFRIFTWRGCPDCRTKDDRVNTHIQNEKRLLNPDTFDDEYALLEYRRERLRDAARRLKMRAVAFGTDKEEEPRLAGTEWTTMTIAAAKVTYSRPTRHWRRETPSDERRKPRQRPTIEQPQYVELIGDGAIPATRQREEQQPPSNGQHTAQQRPAVKEPQPVDLEGNRAVSVQGPRQETQAPPPPGPSGRPAIHLIRYGGKNQGLRRKPTCPDLRGRAAQQARQRNPLIDMATELEVLSPIRNPRAPSDHLGNNDRSHLPSQRPDVPDLHMGPDSHKYTQVDYFFAVPQAAQGRSRSRLTVKKPKPAPPQAWNDSDFQPYRPSVPHAFCPEGPRSLLDGVQDAAAVNGGKDASLGALGKLLL